jgi:2-iminobutanoate/2-iminopropanoate deaminase
MSIPPPVGPYSPLRRVGDFYYCSGQIGQIDGKLVDGGFETQARQTLDNLRAVFASDDVGLDKLVKTTVFLDDMSNYAAMNSIYAEYFTSNPPARSAVCVKALPLSASIEIEAIAHVG